MDKPHVTREPRTRVIATRLVILAVAFVFAFRQDLYQLGWFAFWSSDWSHAAATPVLAGILIHRRWPDYSAAITHESRLRFVVLGAGVAYCFLIAAIQPFLYLILAAPLVFAACASVAHFGLRFTLQLAPVWAMLLLSVPLAERPMERLTMSVQRYSLRASAAVMDLLPGSDVRVTEGVIAFRHADRSSRVGLAERRFGARLLPGCFVLGLFVIFLRRRPVWQVVILLLGAVPLVLVTNCARIILRTGVAMYGGFDVTSSVPRDVSLVGTYVVAYILFAGCAFVLDRALVEETEDDE